MDDWENQRFLICVERAYGISEFQRIAGVAEAKKLAIDVYKVTRSGNLSRDYGLRDQIQRSAVSIPSNIAEGYERNSDKEFARFLMIAKGSIAELRTQLEICMEIGYLDTEVFNTREGQCNKIGAMTTMLIKSRMGHDK